MSSFDFIVESCLRESGVECVKNVETPGLYTIRANTEHAALLVTIFGQWERKAQHGGLLVMRASAIFPAICPVAKQSEMLKYFNRVNFALDAGSLEMSDNGEMLLKQGLRLLDVPLTKEIVNSLLLGAVVFAARYAIGINAVLYGNVDYLSAFRQALEAPDPRI